MKTTKLFLSALAFIGMLASCGPEEKPDNGGETPEPEVKSTECRLTAFTVTAGDFEIEGFIDQTDKTIELSYMPNQFAALTAATAEVKISDKATISPDPTVARDYTGEGGVEFTVTAEDGETTNVYTVYAAAAEVSVKVEKKWSKTYGQMGLAASTSNMCGLGFVDREHFATSDFNVYDLEGNKVGTLNIDGIPGFDVYSGQLGAMSNDENGVLVAFVEYNGTYASGDPGVITETWAWLDGWDKAPTKIYSFEYGCNYMSVSGDVKGDFILAFRTGAAVPQMHHVLVFKGGKYWGEDGKSAASWNGPFIQHPGNDGCWGQLLSFFSADPEDGFVCWDSLAAAEYGETGNASSAFYVYESLSSVLNGSAEELPLYGQVNWTIWDSEGRLYNYGNFSTGHVRAFKYNGEKCIIACSGSWPCNWITIQKAENIVEDDPETDEVDEYEANYLLPTDRIDDAAQCYPCCAYVYDPATGTGHVVYAAQSSAVLAYDIVTTVL
jgi:hypothetical protein